MHIVKKSIHTNIRENGMIYDFDAITDRAHTDSVKYDEAERIKLIIASDGAWDENGIAASKQSPKPPVNNTDKILEYDLAGSLRSERNSGGSFSKTLKLGSDFDW